MRFATSPRQDLDNKEIIAQGRADGSTPLVIGNSVFEPLTFAPDVVKFTRKQYIFLHAYKLGVSLAEAAFKADLTPEAAERFLDKPQTVAWLKDRALQHHIKTQWEEPAKWWMLGNDVLEGKRDLTKAQQIVFQEFGQRIVPKKGETGSGTTKIQINIDPQAVKTAIERQNAIDGELA